MVRQSNDGSGTEFSHWFRKNSGIYPSTRHDLSSSCNNPCSTPLFTVHNLDYILRCYQGKKAGWWMLIEEKRYSSDMRYAQKEAFKLVEAACLLDKKFKGFHLVQFENTTPDDGKIWVDGVQISRDEFIRFIRFESSYKMYLPHFKESCISHKKLFRAHIRGGKRNSHKKQREIPLTQYNITEFGE